jgi:hypothetical protein
MNFFKNNFINQQVLPNIYCSFINKRIEKELSDINNAEIKDLTEGGLDESLHQLRQDLDNQNDRKRGLEDKIKAILFTISISITAITFSLTYEKNVFVNYFDLFSLAFIVLSILFFVLSAIISIRTLMPVGFHILQSNILFSKEQKTIELKTETKQHEIKKLLKFKLQNDNVHLRTSNSVYSALQLLRNGIIMFAAYFVFALVQKNINANERKVIINDAATVAINDSTRVVLPYSFELKVNLMDFKFHKDSIKLLK